MITTQSNDKYNETVKSTDITELQLKAALGNLLEEQGRLDEAKSLLVDVMESTVQSLGPDNPQSLAAMDNLAELYSLAGWFFDEYMFFDFSFCVVLCCVVSVIILYVR